MGHATFRSTLALSLLFCTAVVGSPSASNSSSRSEDPVVKVVQTQVKRNIKKTLDVYLRRRVPLSFVESYATRLRLENSQFRVFFVRFWLHGIDASAAWAVANWTPAPSFRVLGLTIEEYGKALAGQVPANDGVIGAWFMPGTLGHKITFYKKGSSVYLHQSFGDGGQRSLKLTIKKTKRGLRYIEGPNRFGEFWLINRNGELESWDKDGLINKMAKLK